MSAVDCCPCHSGRLTGIDVIPNCMSVAKLTRFFATSANVYLNCISLSWDLFALLLTMPHTGTHKSIF